MDEYSDREPEFDEPDETDPADSEDFRKDLLGKIAKDILSEDVEKRFQALSLIEQFECEPQLADFFSVLLSDPDPDHIRTGVIGMGIWRHSDGVAMLINFLTDAHNKDVLTGPLEEEIILSIGSIGGLDALEFLENYAKQRFDFHTSEEDSLGMAAIEGITRMAGNGHSGAVSFLISGCGHPAWNMRETCADSFSVLFKGKEEIPKRVYDALMKCSRDENKNVRIAAFLSLDEIVGLDEPNKKLLADARHKQVFGS